MKEPLYCQRKLIDPEKLFLWCKQNGIKNIHDPSEMHLTVAYSKEPVFWSRITPDTKRVHLNGAEKRELKVLGSTLVLAVPAENSYLLKRFNYYTENGCSWDFPSYVPHISIASDYSEVPAIHPYADDLLLGPEEMSELKEGYTPTTASFNSDSVYDMIEAYVKVDFIDMVVAALKENKIKVEDKNAMEQSVSARYKNMTMIIRPDQIQFLLFLNNSELLEMNSPGFAPVPSGKTAKGMSAIFKRYKTKYDKLVENMGTLVKLDAAMTKLKNSIKLNGVIDRLGDRGTVDDDF